MSDLYEQVEPSSKDDYEVLDQKDSVYEEEDEPISILSDKANVVDMKEEYIPKPMPKRIKIVRYKRICCLVTWIFLTVFFLVLTIIAVGAAFKMLPFIPDCYPWFKFGGGGSC